MAARNCIVTGAGSGVGRAAALLLAQRGVNVIIADVSFSRLTDTRELITKAVGKKAKVDMIVADVSKVDDVKRIVNKGIAVAGRIDCAINTVCIECSPAPLVEQHVEAFDRCIAVAVRGTFLCLRNELEQMMKQTPRPSSGAAADTAAVGARGAILNIASVAGMAGMAEQAPYSASMHAILGLTRSAAREYAAHGIRVNALCPGVDAQCPLGRVATAEEIAELAWFLLVGPCECVVGTALAADGGWSC